MTGCAAVLPSRVHPALCTSVVGLPQRDNLTVYQSESVRDGVSVCPARPCVLSAGDDGPFQPFRHLMNLFDGEAGKAKSGGADWCVVERVFIRRADQEAFIGGTHSRETRRVGTEGIRLIVGKRMSWIKGTHLYPFEDPDTTVAEVQLAGQSKM